MYKHNAGAFTWENVRITLGMFAGLFALAVVCMVVGSWLGAIFG